ncbi:MAG TPA: thioredoxin domain-containing protein, partial [Myxococcota bacterium]|nr:thioredoxin domain-containing protein [Myxococcota bacterium]
MRTLGRAIAGVAAAVWLAALGSGCGPSSKDIAELRAKQDEILTKLASIEDSQKKILAARPAGPQGEDFDKVYAIGIEASPVRGDAQGPVTIVEFSDFQCPYCAKAAPLIADVLKKYPKGVRFVYKQFPLPFHPAARAAAEASLAAQEQGKFWEMHDVLIQNQATLDAAKIEQYAKTAGLDVARFKADLAKNKAAYDQRIDGEIKLGDSVDVRGTPTIFIDGKKVRVRTV